MKKILLLFCSALLGTGINAQTFITGNTAPVKLSDVVAAYKSTHPDFGEKKNNILHTIIPGLPKEDDDKDYQFARWLWYWQQHLDVNGNMVSPVKTLQEWQKQQEITHAAGRTTSSGPLGDWTFQGPDSSGANGNGVGRINIVAFHPTDVNAYWIGSPGGGAWKTTNNGVSWTCMTDQLPLLSVSDIVFNPLNGNTIYLCTGDRDGQDYYGIGLLKSYNGGATWNTTGVTWTTSQFDIANSLLVNPLDTNSLLLATTAGLMRSFNGGTTWTNVGPAGDFYQLLYRPNDTNIVYATTFNYTGGAKIYRSKNGGSTWTLITTLSDADRISLAVTVANQNIVKAIASSSSSTDQDGLEGIYSSSDTGNTYTEVFTPDACSSGNQNLLSFNADGTQCTGQGWYDLPIAISPTNANLVFIGGVNGWTSSNGGTSWTIMNQWDNSLRHVAVIHADKHFMGFNPLLPGTFFESNDGGVYSTTNPTSTGTWTNLTNGLGIEEIYRTAVSNKAHFELLGAQDVGSKLVRNGIYEEADGGDGMVCQLDFSDTLIGYTASEYGYIDILNPITSLNPNDISGNIAGGSVEGTGGWLTPYVLEPSCHNCILAGYTKIYRSTNEGTSWSTISPTLTTSAGNGDLLRIATTVADSNTIYVAEDGTYNIFYTYNQGTTWTTITAPYSGYNFTSDIKVDPRDKNHIWATFSGYGGPLVAQWSLSGGWSEMNTGLPDVPVNCIAVDSSNRDLYVGTDIGVYFRDTTMTSWVPYTYGMPSLRVNDLEINYGTNEIWAATFGRSLWESGKHLITSLDTGATTAISIVPFVLNGITVAPNPNHGSFTITTKNVADQQVTMHLVDNNGRIVWQDQGNLSANQVNVAIRDIASATYIFEIATANGIIGRQKIVIY